MSTLTLASSPPAVEVRISDDTLTVALADGRVVSVPISWYPRLSHALPQHRSIWEFIGRGHGIHWPELDEDIRVDRVLGLRLGPATSHPGCCWHCNVMIKAGHCDEPRTA